MPTNICIKQYRVFSEQSNFLLQFLTFIVKNYQNKSIMILFLTLTNILIHLCYGLDGERRLSPFTPQGRDSMLNHTMTYRSLGKTGLRVSTLSYGAWLTFSESSQIATIEKAKAIIKACIETGINFFDNAESYGAYWGESETIMGEAITQLIKEKVIKRSDLVISTKWFRSGSGVNDKGLSRKKIRESVHQSLKRLQLDYIDLVYCHRFDPTTPLEETVRVMSWVIDQGWALYWGTSMWSAFEIQQAVYIIF